MILLKKYIDLLLGFLQPHLELANSHMVDFFTKSAFNTHLPQDILEEINNSGSKNVIKLLFEDNLNLLSEFKKFVQKTRGFSVKNTEFCLDLPDFHKKLEEWGCKNVESLKLDVFMTDKKSHEVEILSKIVVEIHQITGTSHIVDIGDGKGYLSSILAFNNGIPVLGIDASDINTTNASKRASKLSKHWNGIVKSQSELATNFQLYKQMNSFVDVETGIPRLILDAFGESGPIGLVGLHTCGNLAPNSLRIFHRNPEIKSICNVGCCYHLLSETFDDNTGFPLSVHLKKMKINLGINARMIAAQSIDRIFVKKQLPNKTIFYRSLLQVILKDKFGDLPEKHVGKLRKSPDSFADYVDKATKKIGVKLDLNDEEMKLYLKKYEKYENDLNLFYLIRCLLSPVIESLIVLDRLLFLEENGYEDAFIVKLFDPVISPRCYGVIAIKR